MGDQINHKAITVILSGIVAVIVVLNLALIWLTITG